MNPHGTDFLPPLGLARFTYDSRAAFSAYKSRKFFKSRTATFFAAIGRTVITVGFIAAFLAYVASKKQRTVSIMFALSALTAVYA